MNRSDFNKHKQVKYIELIIAHALPFLKKLKIPHIGCISFVSFLDKRKKPLAFLSRKIIKFCEFWLSAFKFLQNMRKFTGLPQAGMYDFYSFVILKMKPSFYNRRVHIDPAFSLI